MKKNKVVLVLSCIFSLSFLFFVIYTTENLGNVENTLAISPNIQDVTDKIETKIFVTNKEIDSGWSEPDFLDSHWKSIKIPKDWVPKESEFKEGNFTYYRILVPKESISKLSHLHNESVLSLYYVLFSKVDVFVNGVFRSTNKPRNYNESILSIPIDESKDNIIALKGYIKTGDTGINHHGKIFAGREAELNELHRKSYKGQTVFSLIFILCKGSILFIFTLIFLVMKVERFFEKSLMFGMFVLLEDILTGDYLTHLLNLNQMVYLYNLANIGATIFLFLFMSDVIQLKYSKKLIGVIVGSLFVTSFLVAFDVLYTSYVFTIDDFLKFWNAIMIVVLLNFIPRVFKADKILFFALSIAAILTGYSAFFSSNVGHNLKEISGLLIFFMVAYQTFILFRRQQNQLIEQEKDVAIGKTAAILAHDVRRPLDQMNLILNRISAGEANPEFLKVAKQDVEFAITSVNNQINDIMSFSRTREIILEPVSFYSVLSASIKQVLTISKNVALYLEYDFKAPNKILGDESRLASVLTNLISNAVEAIKDIGGKSSGVIRFTTIVEKDYLIFKIFNDGPLIPANVLSDIFKPLFTFGKIRGTGLGLASVAKVVNEHGGQINVMNLSNGVEFSLCLKASDLPDTISMTNFKTKSEDYSYELKNINEDTGDRHLRILLLDDDRYVYEYFQDLIKKISFEVELVHVGDVDRAREVLKSKRFDLYILDYDLGSNMTGLDFYHENLYFLKSNVVLHSNRDTSTINNLDILLFSKPMSFETLTSLCEEAFQTRPRILLVEDSKLISLAWKMFHGKHNIHCVSSPEEALKFLGSDPEAVEICVLDYYYDGIEMNGVELGDKIILLYPEIKIVISTSDELLKSKFKILKKNEYEFRRLVI